MLIGIDLGTNNTVLSYYENGHLHVIGKAIPSIVYVKDDIKAGIDKLYLEFKNESKILESLIDLIINNFSTNIIQSFYISKIQSTKYIEEYIS